MKTKVLVSAFAATLLGLSTAAFAQSTGTRGVTGGTIGQDNPGANEAPATGANGANSATVGTTPDGRYTSKRDRNASRGSSSGAYVPERPSNAQDKNDPEHPNVKSAQPDR